MAIKMEYISIIYTPLSFKIYLNSCIMVYIDEYFASPVPKSEYRIQWEGEPKER